jgi:hypothetical protein
MVLLGPQTREIPWGDIQDIRIDKRPGPGRGPFSLCAYAYLTSGERVLLLSRRNLGGRFEHDVAEIQKVWSERRVVQWLAVPATPPQPSLWRPSNGFYVVLAVALIAWLIAFTIIGQFVQGTGRVAALVALPVGPLLLLAGATVYIGRSRRTAGGPRHSR